MGVLTAMEQHLRVDSWVAGTFLKFLNMISDAIQIYPKKVCLS